MKKLRGEKQAKALQAAMVDLIGAFDEDRTQSGLSAEMIDAHIVGILINLLRLVVSDRETYSAEALIGVAEEELRAAERLRA